MKRALVLAGGGARGSYQVGMLLELVVKQKLDFQVIRGVSVGALNASVLAQAPMEGNSVVNLKRKVWELKRLWSAEIKGNHSVYAERAGMAGLPLGADSLYSLKPLWTLMKRYVSQDDLKASGRNFKVGTVSLLSGKYEETGPQDPLFMERLLASASIPVVFPFVDLKQAEPKDVLVDGGARNVTPLSSAFKEGPDEIYVLLTSRMLRRGKKLNESNVQKHDYSQWDDSWLGTKVNGIHVLKRTIDILTDEVHLNDIEGALKWNSVVTAIQTVIDTAAGASLPGDVSKSVTALKKALKDAGRRAVKIKVLAPREWYGDKNASTDFSPGLIAEAIKHGQEVAADPAKWLWPPA